MLWLGCTAEVIATDLTVGDNYFQKGQFEAAIKVWQAELAQYSASEVSTPPSDRILDIYRRLAAAYQNLGMHKHVFSTLIEGVSWAEKAQSVPHSAQLLSQLSDAWLTVGDTQEALQRAHDAVADARLTQDSQILADTLNTLANAQLLSGDIDSALESYQQAQQAAQGIPHLSFKIAINHLKAVLNDQPLEESKKQLFQVQTLLAALPNHSYDKIQGLISLSLIAQNLLKQHLAIQEDQRFANTLLADNPSEEEQELAQIWLETPRLTPQDWEQLSTLTYQLLTQAIQLAKQLQIPSSLAYALTYLGNLHEQQGRYEDALTLTQQAQFYANQGHYPHILYQIYWQKGRILTQLQQPDQAIAAYQLSADLLKDLQQKLSIGYRALPGSFDDWVRPVYYELADLLLQKAQKAPERAQQQALLRQARDTVELVKVAELQNYFHDECLTALQARQTTLDEVIDRTAVIYPIPLAERLVVLVTLKDGLHLIEQPVSRQQVNDTAWQLRLGLQTRPNNRFLYPARELYQWMIKPIEQQLKQQQVDTIIVVPDGKLRMIPFSTLHDGQHYLIENYAVVTTPGLTLTEPQPINWQNSQLLLIGLSEAVQEYPPLPSVPKEIHTIQEIAGADRAYKIMNQEYSIEKFRQTLKSTEYSIIHLATHGEFDSDPDHTYLLTYEDKMNMDKLQSVIGLGKFRKKPIELLTLSACKTAVGDDKAALGLAGVAIKAGARSAIATLWFVDDEATALTIMEFYQQLLRGPGLTKAKALQNAQKKLIAQDRYWHPSYWGPFLLIGNWL